MPSKSISPLARPAGGVRFSPRGNDSYVEHLSDDPEALASSEEQTDGWVHVREGHQTGYARPLVGPDEHNGDAYTRSALPPGVGKLRSAVTTLFPWPTVFNPSVVSTSAAVQVGRAGRAGVAVCQQAGQCLQGLMSEAVPATVDTAYTLYACGQHIVEGVQDQVHWAGCSPAQRCDAELVYNWLLKNGYVHPVRKVMNKKLDIETLMQRDVRNDATFSRLNIQQLGNLCAGLAGKSGRVLNPRDIATALKGT